LNTEAAARTKRERRRANEIKTKTIQRMQLQMTAPLDIGLEQSDPSLGMGQEDVFDLTGTERELRNKGGIGIIRVDEDTPEDEEEDEVVVEDEEDEVLDSEEERDRKTSQLEAELDGLYDAYQEKLKERDAQFRAKEARRKNGLLEEWGGIQKGDDSESDEEGGWDQMEAAKGNVDGDSSDESDIEEEPETPGRKRRRPQETETKPGKKIKLVTKLEEPITGSRASQVWFSQGLFGDLEGLDHVEEDAEDVDMTSVQHGEDEEEWQDDVRSKSLILSSMLMRSTSLLQYRMMTSRLCPSRTTTMLKCGTLRTKTKTK
jgi:AdoMet-dependent rRNA methyltransferase SPB1